MRWFHEINTFVCYVFFQWTSESQVMWAVKEEPHTGHIILIYVIQHWHVLSHVGPKQRTNIWNSGSAIQFRLAGKTPTMISIHRVCSLVYTSGKITFLDEIKIKEFFGCLVSHMHIHLAQRISIPATYSLGKIIRLVTGSDLGLIQPLINGRIHW